MSITIIQFNISYRQEQLLAATTIQQHMLVASRFFHAKGDGFVGLDFLGREISVAETAEILVLPQIPRRKGRTCWPPEGLGLEANGLRRILLVVERHGDRSVRQFAGPDSEITVLHWAALRRDVLVDGDDIVVEENFALQVTDPRHALDRTCVGVMVTMVVVVVVYGDGYGVGYGNGW